MNIQLKETILDIQIRSMEECMKGTSFFLPRETQMPLIDIAKRRLMWGWEVTHISKLLFKAKRTVEDRWGIEHTVTLRYYFCTGEYVVNFDDDLPGNREFEFTCGTIAKIKIRRWLEGKCRF